jgi:group I intron endonuclease
VGSSDKIERRWQHHRKDLRNNTHYNKHFQHSWNKYGESNFRFIVIQKCNKEDLLKIEQIYLNECSKNPLSNYNEIYIAGGGNITEGRIRINKNGIIKSIFPLEIDQYLSNGWTSGMGKMKPETKIKIGNANRGKKKPIFSIEHRRKLGNANRGRKYIMSNECKEKIRIALTGRIHSPESILKMGLKGNKHPLYGKHHTPETCLKLSKILKGKFTGTKNPRFDNTVYHFQNIKTNEIISLTRYDFYKRYNLNASNVNKLIKGRVANVGGWNLIKYFHS